MHNDRRLYEPTPLNKKKQPKTGTWHVFHIEIALVEPAKTTFT